MEGSDVRILSLFSRLVGRKAFPQVIFVTTMWGLLDEDGKKVAYNREKELEEDFWREMVAEGSHVQRFQGSKASQTGSFRSLWEMQTQ